MKTSITVELTEKEVFDAVTAAAKSAMTAKPLGGVVCRVNVSDERKVTGASVEFQYLNSQQAK